MPKKSEFLTCFTTLPLKTFDQNFRHLTCLVNEFSDVAVEHMCLHQMQMWNEKGKFVMVHSNAQFLEKQHNSTKTLR